MTKYEKENFITSIESDVNIICEHLGHDVASSVFHRYDAHNVDDLNPVYLPDVFSELELIVSDCY